METDILTFTKILTSESASVTPCFPYIISISLSWFPLYASATLCYAMGIGEISMHTIHTQPGRLVPLSLHVWQSSRPASFSPAGLTLWPSWLERWLATLSGLSVQAPVPLRLSSNVMTLHWHNVDVNKMSTLTLVTLCWHFPLATDVSKCFIGRDCFHTHCCCREQPFCALWVFVTSQIGVDRFPRQCFSSVSYWFSSKLKIFHLDENVYLCHLTNILHVYCDYFPSSAPEVNFWWNVNAPMSWD